MNSDKESMVSLVTMNELFCVECLVIDDFIKVGFYSFSVHTTKEGNDLYYYANLKY